MTTHPYSDGFIVSFWEKIFKVLSYISIFYYISLIRKRITTKNNYLFVEYWVIGNLICSICASLIAYNFPSNILAITLSTYGILRIFEIVVYQTNVMLFDSYRALKEGREYVIKSPTRLVILLLHNYVEIIFWFTTVTISYLNIENLETSSWFYYLHMNFKCITTFDISEILSNITNRSPYLLIAFFESVIGFLMTIISLARFIGLLPQVKSIEKI